MATERREESLREVRLEGVALVVVGGLLLGAITGAFLLGRWVERRTQPPVESGAAAADPLGQVVPPSDIEDTAASRNFFDEVEGGQKEAEPERQAVPPREREEPAASASATAGKYFVQVAAVSDRAAADALVNKLVADGYGAKLVAGEGSLLRVRVGGYASEEEAREAVRRLRQGGHADAFIARAR